MPKALCVQRDLSLVEVIEGEHETRRRFRESDLPGNAPIDLPSLEINAVGSFLLVNGLDFTPFRKAALAFNLAARSRDHCERLHLRQSTAHVLSPSFDDAIVGLKKHGADILDMSSDYGEILARVDRARVEPTSVAMDFFLLSTTNRFFPSWRIIKIVFLDTAKQVSAAASTPQSIQAR